MTVTQFLSAALALAALPSGPSPSSSQGPAEPFHFTIAHIADLHPRLPLPLPLDAPAATAADTEVAVRLALFSAHVQLPAHATASSQPALWDAAHQCSAAHAAFLRSPYLWHLVHHSTHMWRGLFEGLRARAPELEALLCAPAVPGISSLGDVDALLPRAYAAPAGPGEVEVKVRVEDMVLAARVVPLMQMFHVWTFAGRLNLHLTYNVACFAREVAEGYFQKVVEVVRLAGVEDVGEGEDE